MIKLETLIHSIEEHFHITVFGSYSSREYVESVRFIDDNDATVAYLLPNCFYLANFSGYGENTFYGNVLFIGSEDRTPAGNAMYISENLDIFEVYNYISVVFQESRKFVRNKDKLFRDLVLGKGLGVLLSSAYSMLQKQIVVCDSSFGVIASYPTTQDNAALHFTDDRIVVRPRYISRMKKDHVLDILYHSVYPFVLDGDELHDATRIFESIRIQGAVVGYLFISSPTPEISDDELDLIHALSQMISIQLQKDNNYANPEGIKYDLFVKNLISDNFFSEETALNHLAFLGIKPQPYFYVISIGFSTGYKRLLATNYYCEQLHLIFPNSVPGTSGSSFIALVTTSQPHYANADILRKFEAFLKMHHMTAAISYIFDSITDAHLYFTQSDFLLESKRMLRSEDPISYYETDYLDHMLKLSSHHSAVAASIHPSIKFMRKYDKQNKTRYFETLEMYFAQNRSAPATAKALFIHKSTLFYRLDKMQSLFDIDFNDPKKLLACEYSIAIMHALQTN